MSKYTRFQTVIAGVDFINIFTDFDKYVENVDQFSTGSNLSVVALSDVDSSIPGAVVDAGIHGVVVGAGIREAVVDDGIPGAVVGAGIPGAVVGASKKRAPDDDDNSIIRDSKKCRLSVGASGDVDIDLFTLGTSDDADIDLFTLKELEEHPLPL